jgi:lipopolysaccharide transport system permease protein
VGPLWQLINFLVFAGSFILIFGPSSGSGTYPVYVTAGLFVWLYISEVLTLSVTLFVREQSFIQGTTLPLSVHVMRLTMQSLIRAGFALIGCIVIIVFEGVPLSIGWVWSGCALAFIVLITPSVVIILAIAGSFFPDLQFVVSNVMRLGIFVTPVIWTVTTGDKIRESFYYWNPITYFLEIVRIPLLSGQFPVTAFLISGAIGLASWVTAIALLGTYRQEIAFVL